MFSTNSRVESSMYVCNCRRSRPFLMLFNCVILLAAVVWSGPVITGVDEVLLKEDNLYLIRYSPWTYQRWGRQQLQLWAGKKLEGPEWTPIVKPVTQFVPLQMASGQTRNFLVLESVEKRIWQLDSALQVLSSMKLPEELHDWRLDEFRMFWTQGHRFTFVNAAAGDVYQYLESFGKLSLTRQEKIPLSCHDCFLARAVPDTGKFANYPFTCVAQDSLIIFDQFFSGKQKAAKSLMSKPQQALSQKGSALPWIMFDEPGKLIFRYQIAGLDFCFKPEAGEFYLCREK